MHSIWRTSLLLQSQSQSQSQSAIERARRAYRMGVRPSLPLGYVGSPLPCIVSLILPIEVCICIKENVSTLIATDGQSMEWKPQERPCIARSIRVPNTSITTNGDAIRKGARHMHRLCLRMGVLVCIASNTKRECASIGQPRSASRLHVVSKRLSVHWTPRIVFTARVMHPMVMSTRSAESVLTRVAGVDLSLLYQMTNVPPYVSSTKRKAVCVTATLDATKWGVRGTG